MGNKIQGEKGWGVLHVDPQKDFMEGGSLGVTGGRSIISTLNKLTILAQERKIPVAMSADWHPSNTKHFKKFGGPWPMHCVANTPGAEFGPGVNIKGVTIFHKGMSQEDDGYSPWEGVSASGETLDAYFRNRGVSNIIIDGLATEYCVKAAVLGALQLRYKVFVVEDAIKAVNIHPGDGDKAMKEMKSKGAQCIRFQQIV